MTVVPSLLQVEDRLAQHLGIDRVEAAERLVEQHQLRPGDDGGDELHLLRHALGQRLDLLVGPRGQAHAFEPVVDGRPRCRGSPFSSA